MTERIKIKQFLLALVIILVLSATGQGEEQGNRVVPDCGDGNNGGGSTQKGSSTYPSCWSDLQWAAGSPSSIPANGSGAATVENGFAPFSWELSSGSDYSFSDSAQVTTINTGISRSVTIYGSDFGCSTPSASITATSNMPDSNPISISGTISPEDFEFDYNNGPPSIDGDAQITPGHSSVTIYVNGGIPPYTWSVSPDSGSDYFSLACTTSCSGNSNTLSIEQGTPCLATITITDSCGKQATGYIRGPGGWVQIPDACPIPGPANDGPANRNEGKYRVTQHYYEITASSYGGCGPDGLGFSCEEVACAVICEGADGGSGMGCVECITSLPPSLAPEGSFPCYTRGLCDGDTWVIVRCYATGIFSLHEWQCQ